jgi:hypothetical protein
MWFSWFIFAFALATLLGTWVFAEISVQAKLIWTMVYGVTWVVILLLPGLGLFAQFLLGLGLYFLTFGSEAGRRWRP